MPNSPTAQKVPHHPIHQQTLTRNKPQTPPFHILQDVRRRSRRSAPPFPFHSFLYPQSSQPLLIRLIRFPPHRSAKRASRNSSSKPAAPAAAAAAAVTSRRSKLTLPPSPLRRLSMFLTNIDPYARQHEGTHPPISNAHPFPPSPSPPIPPPPPSFLPRPLKPPLRPAPQQTHVHPSSHKSCSPTPRTD